MRDFKKRELEAEMAYKKALLSDENNEIKEIFERVKDYMENKFEKEDENRHDRYRFFEDVNSMRFHVDNSRARMEEIEDLEEDLGLKEEEYI